MVVGYGQTGEAAAQVVYCKSPVDAQRLPCCDEDTRQM